MLTYWLSAKVFESVAFSEGMCSVPPQALGWQIIAALCGGAKQFLRAQRGLDWEVVGVSSMFFMRGLMGKAFRAKCSISLEDPGRYLVLVELVYLDSGRIFHSGTVVLKPLGWKFANSSLLIPKPTDWEPRRMEVEISTDQLFALPELWARPDVLGGALAMRKFNPGLWEGWTQRGPEVYLSDRASVGSVCGSVTWSTNFYLEPPEFPVTQVVFEGRADPNLNSCRTRNGRQRDALKLIVIARASGSEDQQADIGAGYLTFVKLEPAELMQGFRRMTS